MARAQRAQARVRLGDGGTQISGAVGHATALRRDRFILRGGRAPLRTMKRCRGIFSAMTHDPQADDPLAPATCEGTRRIKIEPIKPSLQRVVHDLERAYAGGPRPAGIPSSLRRLNECTGGLRPGELTVIAGRRLMGATSLALSLAAHAAIQREVPTLIFSLDESKERICRRVISSLAGIDSFKICSGRFLNDDDMARLAKAASRLAESRIYIDDAQDPTIDELVGAARAWRAGQTGPVLIVIDGVRLLEETRPPAANGWRDWSRMGAALKHLAIDLGAAVVVVGGLCECVDERTDHRPVWSDLDPRAFERVADVVAFLYRDEAYSNEACADEDRGVVEIILAKHPSGTSCVRVRFASQFSRFDDLPEG